MSLAEYERQGRQCAQESLVSLLNAIIDDERMSSKLKKKRIKQVLPPAVFVFARYHDVFYYQRTK